MKLRPEPASQAQGLAERSFALAIAARLDFMVSMIESVVQALLHNVQPMRQAYSINTTLCGLGNDDEAICAMSKVPIKVDVDLTQPLKQTKVCFARLATEMH